MPLVTVAIPIYKRLNVLPRALTSVARQTYPAIDLLVSDNGGHGDRLRQLVMEHYPGAVRLRANERTVPVAQHFNQLLAEATGAYFVLLCDDDVISHDFVSELVTRLEASPAAHVAVGRPETVDHTLSVRTFAGEWPDVLGGVEFLERWATKRIRLVSTVTIMARTGTARACGGYLDLPRALYSDNVLLMQLALRGDVILGRSATFRWTIDDASTGYAASHYEVARACRGFFRFLDTDPQFRGLRQTDPSRWSALRAALRMQCAIWYFYRWKDRYSRRLGRFAWVRAAFLLPFPHQYYQLVFRELRESLRLR